MSVQVSSAGTDDSKDDAEDKEYIQVSSTGTDDSKNDSAAAPASSASDVYRYGQSVKQPGATPAAKFLKNRKFLKKRLRHSPRRSLRA
ncbi:hypothetical protein T03_12656 [Trichinella britovi]|uniref:Uncharacterized protein n=1 Tax=Trichinella britovi TaxID=45882 RepID=A0A0V1CTY2_TRIBR|nr:hypothetical protein T03_12656 [Trichinella britovi]